MRLYNKERNPATHEEMSRLADNYASARGQYPKSDKGKNNGNSVDNSDSKDKASKAVTSSDQSTTEKKVIQRKCFICGDPKHLKAKCPKAVVSQVTKQVVVKGDRGPTVSGTVNGKHVSTL